MPPYPSLFASQNELERKVNFGTSLHKSLFLTFADNGTVWDEDQQPEPKGGGCWEGGTETRWLKTAFPAETVETQRKPWKLCGNRWKQ